MTPALFRQLFDPESSTYTYLLADADTREAILIDPVRDQTQRDTTLIRELGLKLIFTLETHVHADHVTASGSLRELLGSKSILSRHAHSACVDVAVSHGERISFGRHFVQVLETPGHTDSCISYYDPEGNRVFTGDALLIRGCGRTDFQQGNARKLYASVTQRLFTLPEDTLVYPGHDYNGRTFTSVAEERQHNPRLANKSEAEFVTIMDDLHMAPPRRIAEAVPANMACGVAQVPDNAPPRGGAWAPIERLNGVPEVTPSWLKLHQSSVRLIDVREPYEYTGAFGHLEGSELVPLATLAHAAKGWDHEQPLVVICHSGRRSGEAAKFLEQVGFKRVASLRGGMSAWR